MLNDVEVHLGVRGLFRGGTETDYSQVGIERLRGFFGDFRRGLFRGLCRGLCRRRTDEGEEGGADGHGHVPAVRHQRQQNLRGSVAGHADAEARRSVLTALPCATLVTVPTVCVCV